MGASGRLIGGEARTRRPELQVRRLPVVNREKRLVGIVSVGDIARRQAVKKTGEAVRGISEPGGRHSQTAGASKEKVGA